MLQVVLTVLIIYLDQQCVLTVKAKIECGYKQCPQTRDGALNVHLIPHSHMDAGWVKTFDEYYYGTKTTVSTANVQLIYHSVLSELLHDKSRKFTFSETAFFWRWWKEQRPATRATFRALVQEGRIEFAGGGWVQNDEATLDYLQIIDLFTWGLRKINDTLGPCGKPKAAWQIDTYGHTREQTSLLAQMGYDGLFIGRVDHKEREAMIEEDRMEFMWRGSDVLGKMSDIMTHTLFNLYNAPEGFCFDFLCSDEPIVDDPDNRVYNAEKRVNDFIAQIERQAKYYDHDNIMVTMGGDFTYQSAANWFMNMDKLINHVNTHPANISDVNIFYSTPSCYLKAIYLYGRRDKAIYTEKSDHIPYSSDASTYWTGYYTSRPSLKYFVRRTHIFLQVVKQLTVIARMGDSYELHLLRHAVNLVMHHDAITGTSQQHVANDFIRTLSEAIESFTKKVSNLLTYLTPTWGGSRRSKNSQQFIVCHQLNMSQCRFTETQDTMLLLVYNPLSVKTYHHVRLPANSLHYSIRDYNDEEVEYQLVPLPAAVINLPGRSSTAIQELCFEAENIPPLGYAAYYVSPVRDPLEENEFAKKSASQANGKNTEPEQDVIPNIANEYIKVAVNKDTGLLESIQHVDGVKIDLSQNYHFYSQTQQGQQSGAYSFRPEKSRPTPVTERVSYHVIRGILVKEIRQRFTDWISQVIRLYRGEEFVELEWIIGPVPVGTDLGKEVVSLFKTNVTNSGHFYTDSNSRQMTKRTCWNESATQQQKKIISGCYYPVTSRICIQSANTSVGMCVLTDRTQGGTSYNEGEVELMVHRRLLTDDGFGLEESLNEEAFGLGLVVKGKHRILFGNLRQEVDDLSFDERVSQGARRWLLEPWLFMTSGDKLNRRKWQNVRNKRYSALRLHGLPRHVHVLTLEPWKGGSVLLRLENTLEKSTRGRFRNEKLDGPEDFAAKQSHITVQLRQLFLQLKIRAVRETTLAANQWLDDARQMDWSTRYVYNGADDDILPEDNVEYKEEPKPVKEVERETVPYSSDEGQDYQKRTQRMRENARRIPYRERDRRKRSANSTENINENIINGTFDKHTHDRIGNGSDDVNHNFIAATRQLELNMGTIVVEDATTANYKHTAKPTSIFNLIKDMKPVTKPSPKLSFLSPKHFAKPSTFFIDLETSEAETEEDFSDNLKKRFPRRMHRNGSRNAKKLRAPQASQPPAEDCDDGITKSIFEMYYKTKTNPRKSLHPYHGSSEEFREEPRRRRRKKTKTRRFKSNDDYGSAEVKKEDNIQDSEETTRRTEKSRHYYRDRVGSEERSRNRKKGHLVGADMPFFVTGEAKRYKLRKRDKEASMEERNRRRNGDRNRDREEFAEEREFTKAEAANRQSHTRREEAAYSQEYEPSPLDLDEEEKELANEERQVGEGRERIKRAPPRLEPPPEPTSEQAEQADAEPEFTITLRPTQIRTFVIWFEIAKNPYTS